MTQFEQKSFSVAALATQEYRDNWDRIFSRKPATNAQSAEEETADPVQDLRRGMDESCRHIQADAIAPHALERFRDAARLLPSLWETISSAEAFANHLVDNVACATQLDPEKGELPNVEDWRRNAVTLYGHARLLDGKIRNVLRLCADLLEGEAPDVASDIRALCDQHDNDTDATNNTDRNQDTGSGTRK